MHYFHFFPEISEIPTNYFVTGDKVCHNHKKNVGTEKTSCTSSKRSSIFALLRRILICTEGSKASGQKSVTCCARCLMKEEELKHIMQYRRLMRQWNVGYTEKSESKFFGKQ
ncbi:hypothetical protein TNIN_479021 [Trichonephila inaurata madagascariensis]|uniref:Uncharacterized protein n=1 Tax=Trichonephila inaurata madagascariensis TaxID=2747483 RepID=A0A8X6X853_9ARAC|nr:hypothetical protein TNIN_479021 [Trichonephila inaurata madagascariensis]